MLEKNKKMYFFKKRYYFYLSVFVCVYVLGGAHVCRCLSSAKEGGNALELKLEVLVSHSVKLLVTELRSAGRAADALTTEPSLQLPGTTFHLLVIIRR